MVQEYKDELKPCPFCESVDTKFAGASIVCNRCHCTGPVASVKEYPDFGERLLMAITLWNCEVDWGDDDEVIFVPEN